MKPRTSLVLLWLVVLPLPSVILKTVMSLSIFKFPKTLLILCSLLLTLILRLSGLVLWGLVRARPLPSLLARVLEVLFLGKANLTTTFVTIGHSVGLWVFYSEN